MYLSHLKPVKDSHIFKPQVDLKQYFTDRKYASPPRPKKRLFTQIMYDWGSMEIDDVREFEKYSFSKLSNRTGSVKKSIANWKYRTLSRYEFKITVRRITNTGFVVVKRIK